MCRWAYVRGGPCNLLTLLSCTTAWLTAEGNPPHTVAFSELTPPFVKVNPQTMERTQRQVVVFRKRAIRQKGLISLERYKPWRANWRLTLPDACFFRKWYDRDIHVKRLMTRRALHYIDKFGIDPARAFQLYTTEGIQPDLPTIYCYTQVNERRQGVPITNRNSPEHSLSGLRAIHSSKYFIRNHCTIP